MSAESFPADLRQWPLEALADRVEVLEVVVSRQAELIQQQMIQLAEMQIREKRRNRGAP